MNSRRVNKVEQSVIHWWVNSMTLFETKSSQIVTSRDMRSALGLLIDKFPYLTFRIERNSANELIFIENSSDQIENYEFTWNEVKTEEEFNNWPTRLNIFASKGDFTKQLFNIEVDVFQNRLYRLYFRISHAAADGRSVFALLNDLMTYLDAILSGQHQSKPEVTTRKTFLNVHEHLPDIYDLEKLKSEPIFIDNRHKSFGEKAIIEPDVSLIEKIRSSSIGHYAQLDENDSRDLFRKCKQYGVSIQGIFSVAKMISLLNETKTTHSHTDESFEVLNAIPCDMRYFFNLASDDLIKGRLILNQNKYRVSIEIYPSFNFFV